ncbi:MAG: tetratricopeptide repeat protein [Cytophagaceae bacterium]|nr:tetratricopeptide repeat protein [Cytophagaceae bacterium]
MLQAFACMQENRVLLDGQLIHTMGRDFNNENYWKREFGSIYHLHELDSLWKTNKSITDYNDYGVQLVYLKRYKEALVVFQNIERMSPGRYNTLANMGTTYELLGQDKLALEWIKKAVAKNPKSHFGSEWFHVKILEAKIKGPSSWNSTFLIGTDFGTDSIPKSTRSKKALRSLTEDIFHQLLERMKFIKPKDEMMAILLFEYGNLVALTDDATSSYRVYSIAKAYGYSSELFDKRYDYSKKLQLKIEAYENKISVQQEVNKNKKSQQIEVMTSAPRNTVLQLIFFLIPIILLVLVVLLFKFRKKK